MQADFIFDGWFVGMRYTAIGYTADGGNEPLAASSLGVGLGYMHHFSDE